MVVRRSRRAQSALPTATTPEARRISFGTPGEPEGTLLDHISSANEAPPPPPPPSSEHVYPQQPPPSPHYAPTYAGTVPVWSVNSRHTMPAPWVTYQSGPVSGYHTEAAPNYQQPAHSAPVHSAPIFSHFRGEAYSKDRLDIHLNDKLLEDIKEGKAISMARIFQNDPRKNNVVYDSDDESTKKREKDRRLSRSEWIEAFSIYSYTMLGFFPTIAQGMMIHLAHVLELQAAKADWQFFDVTVRRLIAKQGRQWDEPFTNEMMAARARPEVKSYVAQNAGPRYGANMDVPTGYCVPYHKYNDCKDPCPLKYSHRCFKCKGEHRAEGCFNRKPIRGALGASRGRGRNNSQAVGSFRANESTSNSFRGRGPESK